MANAQNAAVLPYGPARLRPFFRGAAPVTHVLLRVAAALLFMQHGAQKLFGWLGGFGGEPGATAPLVSLMGLAGVLEVFGGLLLLLGLLTRPVALVLVAEMIVAYVMAHMPQGGWPIQNQGELALLYAAIFVFFVANGAGPLSVDHWVAQRRARRLQTAERARRVPEVERVARRARDAAA